MAIDTAFMIARCRSNWAEPYSNEDPQRSDAEAAAWLQEAQMDLIAKCPADSFPELIEEAAFTGASWTIATDYMKLLQVELTHTVSGTETNIETAFVLPIDGGYISSRYDGGIGAWAKFHEDVIKTGPNTISGTITYQRRPITLAEGCPTLELKDEHADAIINYATAMGLYKLNDADAAAYMERYESKVQAEREKFGMEVEVEKVP